MNILSFPYIDTATKADLAEGEKLQIAFDKFEAQLATANAFQLNERFCEARATYLASPTDENFEAMKKASFEEHWYRNMDHRIHSLAHEARAQFIEKQIVPWATGLLVRALTKARENLAEVTKEEDARHRKLTGSPLTVSGIVEAAKKPVRHLESFLMDVPENPRSFRVEKILRLFRGSGPLIGEMSTTEDRGRGDNLDPRRVVRGHKLLTYADGRNVAPGDKARDDADKPTEQEEEPALSAD